MYSVQAHNMVFPDLETCERVKDINTEVLRNTAPSDTAKFYTKCVMIPRGISV
jgi:hypothetical protein